MECTICAGSPGELVLAARDPVSNECFELRRCVNCSTVFTCPRPVEVSAYYPQDDYYAFKGVSPTVFERARLSLIRRIPYREISRLGPGRMLDVGCGAGRLAGSFSRDGWQVDGIEPSPKGADAARLTGMFVHTGTLDDELPFTDGAFDAVVFNHSLEHLLDPVKALRTARRLARPGGLVGISVPNLASWQPKVFDASWLQIDVPRHLTHFEPSTLIEAARRANLAVVRLGSSSMMASLPQSVARRFNLRVEGRTGRLVGLALYPFLAISDSVVGGDCLNLVARR